MEAPRSCSLPCFLLVLALAAHGCSVSMASCSFTISNYCTHTIWPATGFRLDPGQTVQVPVPAGWSGRIWARTGCNFSTDGSGAGAGAVACQTGDCAGGHMECSGTGGMPPATLFEITLGKGAPTDQDFYDVSLVDGYNLPVIAVPRARQGSCNATGCNADLNLCGRRQCGGAVACRSACEAFAQDKYCCSGAYATPATCSSTAYSSIFKSACPRVYSYAYDDGTSLFTCNAIDYTIAFCIPPAGLNMPGDASSAPPSDNNGAGSIYVPPPMTGNSGVGTIYQPPPTGENGAGSTYVPPPTGNSGVGSIYQPPSTGSSGAGSAYLPHPTGSNGVGSGYHYQPPLATNDGVGSQPPLMGINGLRSTYQPGMMPSSASTLYNKPFLLPAVLMLLI